MAGFELVFDENGKFKMARKNGMKAAAKPKELKKYSLADLKGFTKEEFIFVHGNSVRCIVHGGRLY